MSRSGRGWGEVLAFAAGALVLYLLLGADSFYKVDGIDIVRLLDQGDAHPWHPGYLPALSAFRWLLALVGLEPGLLQLGVWFSAVGAAIGVGCARAGMGRLGMDPRLARFATALFATSPMTLTFATVVEFHGPMLAPMGLCFWWLTVQIKTPSFGGMARLGAMCHLPFLIHSQQALLPAWLLAFFVMRRGVTTRNVLLAATAGAVHAGLILVLPQLFDHVYGHWAELGEGLQKEGSIGRPQSLDYTWDILVQEWILPWLPLSLLVFLAPFRRPLRREFVAFAIGFVPYLYVSVRQLVFEPEYGAYLLPMTLPAAMLIARRLGTKPYVYLMLVFSFVGWYRGPLAHLHEQREEDKAFAAGVAQAAGEQQPYVLIGSHRELGSAYATLDADEFIWLRTLAARRRDKVAPREIAVVEYFLKQQHADGLAVLATPSAMQNLEDPRGAMLAEKATLDVPTNDELVGPVILEKLRAAFDIVGTAGGVWRVTPK